MKASKQVWIPKNAENKEKTPTKLDASAKEWDPVKGRAPFEDRSLFLTFSIGLPLTEYQINRFFSYFFGPFVVRIYVHWPLPNNMDVPALFGKVVFKVSYIPAIVLGGADEARFIVDGRPLSCKKYDPTRRRAVTHNSYIVNSVQH